MDYDDNDFQNQNFQLVGEDNNRFPQSLRSFSLPKFDMDDNLQIQLRFDSLVETEALLGMQGQENNWLEDFSARHSAINFSSNAGESCSMSMHNNVWSEATSSESVEMLLKSVGEDDMLNQKVINKDSDILALDDSTDCRMECDMHNDPTLTPNKCKDVDVVGMQQHDGYTSQNFKGVTEIEPDLSLLDVKADAIKECLDGHEFLELVQNASGNSSVLNSTFDHSGCTAKNDANASTSSLDCSSAQNDPSSAFTSDTNIVTSNMIKESLSEQIVETHHGMSLSMKPELLHPDNELNIGNHIYSVEGTVNNPHFEVDNANDDACKTTFSSSLEPLTDSLVLLKERHSDPVFSQNSEGLLESIAYQVKLANKNIVTENKAVSCSKESASVAILKDGSAQEETADVGDQEVNKCSYANEESKEFSLVVQDNLRLSSSLTRSTYMVSSGEETQPATCQAVGVTQELAVHLSTKICNELRNSSEMLADPLSSTSTTLETRTPASENDGIGVDPLNSNSPETVMKEKSTNEHVTEINNNSNGETSAADDAIINKVPTSDVKLLSSDNCRSGPSVVNDNSNGELCASEDVVIKKSPASDVKISSPIDGKSAPISDTEKLETALSRADSTDIVMDDSSLKESTLSQTVVEEEEAAAIVSPAALDCNKDTSILSSVGKHNSGTTYTAQNFSCGKDFKLNIASSIDAATAKLRDPHVAYLVQGSNISTSETSHSILVHGTELYLNSPNSDSKEVHNENWSITGVTCSDLRPKNKAISRSLIRENADVIHVTVLSNKSRNKSETAAPHAEYFQAPGRARVLSINFKLDVLCFASEDLPVADAISKLIIPGLCDQLDSMKKVIIPVILSQHPQLYPYHFLPPQLLHPITVLYELSYGETEVKQVEIRKSLHSRLDLPLDRPLLRISNALNLGITDVLKNESMKPGSSVLKDVHTEIPSSGVSGGIVSLIDGSYEYYHYLHGIDDNGWGCAYRSLQTIISWYRLQKYTSIEVPSHRDIQQALVEIGDKEPSFIGSREWIGAIELSFVLDKLLGISCKIINVRSGEELPEKCRELAMHFETQGTPVMIGGGVLAYTLLGVDYNEVSGDCAFLILDPHYTGSDNVKKIVNGGWCGWKKAVDAKGRSFFLKDKFYNLLLPQRPNMV